MRSGERGLAWPDGIRACLLLSEQIGLCRPDETQTRPVRDAFLASERGRLAGSAGVMQDQRPLAGHPVEGADRPGIVTGQREHTVDEGVAAVDSARIRARDDLPATGRRAILDERGRVAGRDGHAVANCPGVVTAVVRRDPGQVVILRSRIRRPLLREVPARAGGLDQRTEAGLPGPVVPGHPGDRAETATDCG